MAVFHGTVAEATRCRIPRSVASPPSTPPTWPRARSATHRGSGPRAGGDPDDDVTLARRWTGPEIGAAFVQRVRPARGLPLGWRSGSTRSVDDHLLNDEVGDSPVRVVDDPGGCRRDHPCPVVGVAGGGHHLRNPGLVAKMVATLTTSAGPAVLGLGAGWLEREHEAFGSTSGREPRRGLDRLDEALGLLRRLLDGDGWQLKHGQAITSRRPASDPAMH